MAKSYTNIVDISVTVLSLITFVLDLSTDILVCIELLMQGHEIWGWMMLAFVSVPALLMSAFSLSWHYHDRTLGPATLVLHIFLLAPVERYVYAVYLGLKSRVSRKVVDTQAALTAQSDVSILRLFEAFLESAPQLVLQMYILVTLRTVGWFTGLSACCSLLSLTWSMTAYTDAQRRAHKSVYESRLLRLALHWSWQLFMAAARIAALVAFTAALGYWVLVLMGGHWLIAFIWISARGTDFGSSVCEKWLFRLVCAFIYIFVFLNLNDGKSRWRVTSYYSLVFVENACMVAVFLTLGDSQHLITATCLVVFAGFLLGLLSMLIYYGFLHPSGPGLKNLASKGRSFNTSSSSVGQVAQIFSIESPTLPRGRDRQRFDPGPNTNSSSSAPYTNHTLLTEQSVSVSGRVTSPGNGQQTSLQMAWTSSLSSSSNSSSDSSLASAGLDLQTRPELVRKVSLASDNSLGSACSENQLLPPLPVSKNNVNKCLRQFESASVVPTWQASGEEVSVTSASDNGTVSSSPSLSRNSWARSSDTNRASMAVEFTMLGFDDTSSTEHRPSDSSSLTSRPKSLSPMDVSELLQEVHTHLRATIAATIAAATTRSSASESSPCKSLSLSHTAHISGQEESLSINITGNSSLSLTSPKHNMAFLESAGSGCSEAVSTAWPGGGRSREGMSSLPDILAVLPHDQLSDTPTLDASCHKGGGEAMVQLPSPSPVFSPPPLSPSDLAVLEKVPQHRASYSSGRHLMDNTSPLMEDSTLTVSKLESKRRKPTSYWKATRCQGQLSGEGRDMLDDGPLDLSLNREGGQHIKTRPVSHNGDSPFSDTELVTVMAESLRSYVGGSSGKHRVPQREALALTIDDLRLSGASTPDGSEQAGRSDRSEGVETPDRNEGVGMPDRSEGGSRGTETHASGSWLHEDSRDSSPASSASKMNRIVSEKDPDTNLSPNALKLSDTAHHMYGVGYSQPGNLLPPEPSARAKPSPVYHEKTQIKFTPLSPAAEQHGEARIYPNGSLVLAASSQPSHVSLDKGASPGGTGTPDSQYNSSWQGGGLSLRDLARCSRKSVGPATPKHLNVHTGDFALLQYSKSPGGRNRPDTDSSPDETGYVAGQYRPPLCADHYRTPLCADTENGSDQLTLERNLNCHSWDEKHKKDKVILEKCLDGDNRPPRSRPRNGHLDVTYLNSLREEILKRDSRLEKHRADLISEQRKENIGVDDLSPLNKSKTHRNFTTNCVDNYLAQKQSDVRRAWQHSPSCVCRLPSCVCDSGQSVTSEELNESAHHVAAQHVANYFSHDMLDGDEKPEQSGILQGPTCAQRRQPLQPVNKSTVENNIGVSGQWRQSPARCVPRPVTDLTNSDILCSPVYLLPSQRRRLQQMARVNGPTERLATRPPVHHSLDPGVNSTSLQHKA